MVFKTTGNKSNPVILFFHAMGVTGESSMPVAEKMADKFNCVMPTSTVYCSGQKYRSKKDEVQQIVRFLEKQVKILLIFLLLKRMKHSLFLSLL